MDFFLKRVPAFSRALGEDDSDDEHEWEDSKTEVKIECLNEKGENITLQDLFTANSVSRLVASLGALTTAFVTIGFQLAKRKPIGTLSFFLPNSDKSDSRLDFFLYTIPEISSGFYLLTTTANLDSGSFIQRFCVDQLSGLLFKRPNCVENVVILCAYPVHCFMSRTSKPKAPFMRYLHTQSPIDSDKCTMLEQPNIVSGLPAEFLTSCHIHSIPASLFISFYAPNSHLFCTWPAVKEVLEYMGCLKDFVTDFESITTEWDQKLDEKLVEQCVNSICGGKVSKTEQIYT